MSIRRFVPWLLVLVSMCIVSWQAINNQCYTALPGVPKHARRSEFEDCKMVYLDVGSNIGVQVRKLFEPSRYPGAPVLPLFDKYFGVNRNMSKHLCAIGVEMNPSHTLRLAALETHYREKCGYSVRFFKETAASTRDGMVDFWTDGYKPNNEWGASQVEWGSNLKSRIANALDLVRFITSDIAPFASVVVMKLDVEGAEYDLLPQLLMKGVLCHMDLIFTEYHPWLASRQKVDVVDHINTLIENMPSCRTVLSSLDDESYHHDVDDTIDTC